MKRIISAIIALSMITGAVFTANLAVSALKIGDYSYKILDDDTAAIAKYYGSESDIIIPNELDGHIVSSIGNNAFVRKNMTSITMPDTITKISYDVFGYCQNLESVKLPKKLKSIGMYAFAYCDSLESIELPYGLTTICMSAFIGCTALSSISLPDSVTSLQEFAFMDCVSLSNIELPDSLTFIGMDAFKNTAYQNDKSNWENELLYIGSYLIRGDQNLSGDCIIKDGTIRFANNALGYCTNVESITVPESVTAISEKAFLYCQGLKSVTLLGGVTEIGYNAFRYCDKLTNITLPSTLDTVYPGAFRDCTALTDVYYNGGADDLSNIKVYADNNPLISADVHYGREYSKTVRLSDLIDEQTKPTITCGDANGDGGITAADVLLIRKYLAGWQDTGIDLDGADANSDGDVTAADVLLIRKFLAGWGVTLGKQS